MKINTNTKIGWIGTGVMGNSMCGHLLKHGYRVAVFSRTKSKAQNLILNGAKWCNSPREVAQNSEIIFSIVGYPADVREAYFADDGIFSGLNERSILVDMTTTEPVLAREIYNRAISLNCSSIDAPVSGGDIGAREARLSIMAGGNKDIFNDILPLLEKLGKNIVYQGESGSGQHTKMCNQIAVTGVMISTCETLIYANKAGLNLDSVLSSITKGAATSWTLENLAPRILKKDFAPGFYVDHFIKDMKIALKECERMNIDLPGLSLAYRLYNNLSEMGHGKLGTQSLILALQKL